ncbi:MAG: carbonic anhydrase [Alphaproteobacteria bacterium]|nr:carbonic anhydrase [Alphaproteobacteria bacterium]
MFTRRFFCGCLAGLGALAAAPAMAQTAAECATVTRDRQQRMKPDEVLSLLRAGNERLLTGKTFNCDRIAQVKSTAQGQAPIAAILGCIDSRVVPEIIFDQDIGDIFCARVAGNFANVDNLGSLEFATKAAGAHAIVVLGHNHCGAIKAAVDKVKAGNMTAMLKNFEPAMKAAGKVSGPYNSKNDELVQKVAEANVRLQVQNLPKRSKIIKDLVAAGEVKIAGAMHDVTTGKVTWL